MRSKSILNITICVVMLLVQVSLFAVPTTMYDTFFNIVRPVIYIILMITAMLTYGKNLKIQTGKQTIVMVSILGLVIYIAFTFTAGLLTRFGINSMDTSLFGILKNFWAYIVIVIVREYLRSQIMVSAKDKSKYTTCLLVTLVFTICSIDNLATVVRLDIFQQIDWIFTVLMPVAITNLWFSYSSIYGGLTGNLIYAIGYNAIVLFCPFLPDISQILDAIASYCVIFIMFIIYDSIEWMAKREVGIEVEYGKRNWLWTIIPGAFLLFWILLGLGFFPIVPVAVMSNSMYGEFKRGDLIYVHKKEAYELKKGDVLQYRHGGMSVVHRIIQVNYDRQGNRYFITQGDANEVADMYPVFDEQVIGVAVAKTPYLGWPALLFHGLKE